jgi:hypothetical protein
MEPWKPLPLEERDTVTLLGDERGRGRSGRSAADHHDVCRGRNGADHADDLPKPAWKPHVLKGLVY